MWSGPRNISTAMMRAWGSRGDTWVCDEPLYAHYLRTTGKIHPAREQTLLAHENDWRRVVAQLLGPVPHARMIFYQKHMAHHLLPGIERDWIDQLSNGFLIREPAAMLSSLLKHVPDAQVEDTGLPQQWELFSRIMATNDRPPPVVDAKDVLEDPTGMLRALCQAFDVEFDPGMLRWEPGLRETDGAWAFAWYPEVANTTTFAPYAPKASQVPSTHAHVLMECQRIYDRLSAYRLQAV